MNWSSNSFLNYSYAGSSPVRGAKQKGGHNYMSKVKEVRLSFPPSPSEDVVGYKLFIEEVPNSVTHNSISYDIGNNTSVNLNEIMSGLDAVYNIGVASVDDAGNESDFSLISDVPLDFIPPQATGIITITRL